MQLRHGCLESSILEALWVLESRGNYQNDVANVYDFLAQKEGEKRAYTTIKTVMDRLQKKNILTRYKNGRKFYYRTACSNQEIIIKSINEIKDRYCGGDLTKLALIIQNLIDCKTLAKV